MPDEQLKILLLEDNEDDAHLIERVLRRGQITFSYQRVDKRDEFIVALRDFQPDVILSDHGLPGFSSHEALRLSSQERSGVPFILVTGTVSDEYAISCLRLGIDDYILKSNLARLPIAIRSAIKKRALEKLKRNARHELRSQFNELLKVNKELDNFVYSVSHNLRGPLASVMGLLHLAKGINKDKELASLHEMMSESVSRLDLTMREILDYSRNARNEIMQEEVNWKSIIDDTFTKLNYLLPEKEIARIVDLQTDAPFFSDPARIAVVLTNLISNCILYRDPHRPLVIGVEVTTTARDCSVTITDNGTGINEKVMPKVFEMFFRGTEISKGAGLGLYIVRETVNRLKGNVEIDAIEGSGTTVSFALPNEFPVGH